VVATPVDTNNDGAVDLDEFTTLMSKKMTPSKDMEAESEIAQAFKKFDLDNDGYISSNELKRIMAQLGQHIKDEDINAMMHEADKNKDGVVSFEEFRQIITEALPGLNDREE
jgi:calmodulin